MIPRDPRTIRDAARGARHFIGVRVAALDDASRQAVRREDHLLVLLWRRIANALGKRLEQQRVSVKRSHRHEVDALRQCRHCRVHVFLHAER